MKPIPMPQAVKAINPMAGTNRRLDDLNEKMERMLALLAKIEENTRR